MNPPKSHWTLHYYRDARHPDLVVTEGACDALTDDGYTLLGTHMYCEPLTGYDKQLVGTRYVFALHGREGVGHYDIDHETGDIFITIHEEPAVTADHDVSDAEREADARSQQAADERHAERMRYGR
jgi:hypothetical protein